MTSFLDRLDALSEKATPGPWEPDGDNYLIIAPDPRHCWISICEVSHNSRHDEGRYNRDLICTLSPQTVLALTRALRAAKRGCCTREWEEALADLEKLK